ncbi:MAG: hypothetical protein KME05_13180 [Gloeocapsa sp. UFS-A4-WI-NPMV-4B04]|nr:hypothetical protein [Gloeocapsa sp. UFS-A4-WI-NPMV-4B04]
MLPNNIELICCRRQKTSCQTSAYPPDNPISRANLAQKAQTRANLKCYDDLFTVLNNFILKQRLEVGLTSSNSI